ncbi:MAG: hypothetical protein LBT87_09275, partial [Treponema sp.]|nr:hypothetical protein [Treponema sp.]
MVTRYTKTTQQFAARRRLFKNRPGSETGPASMALRAGQILSAGIRKTVPRSGNAPVAKGLKNLYKVSHGL